METPTTFSEAVHDGLACGACGRSSLGAACMSGFCRPETLTSAGEVAPYALAADATHVYWVSPAQKAGTPPRMRRAPKASPGGAGENALGATNVRAWSLAFAGGKLYWGDLTAGAVLSGAPGAAAPDLAFAAGQPRVQHVTAAAGKLFWAQGPLAVGSNDGAVRSKPLAGGAVSTEAGAEPNPVWVAVDAASVFWVEFGTREVRRKAAAAVASGTAPHAVQLANGCVYWDDAPLGVVRSAPAAGGEAREEFQKPEWVAGFLVDGATLYALTYSAGALSVWRKAEGKAAHLLLGQVSLKNPVDYDANPFGGAHLVADEGYLYFSDLGTVDPFPAVPVSGGDGAVYRVAKLSICRR